MTTWRPIRGFENSYEVSRTGDVRRVLAGRGAHVGRVLSVDPNGNSPRVALTRGKGAQHRRQEWHRIDELVREAFSDPVEPAPSVYALLLTPVRWFTAPEIARALGIELAAVAAELAELEQLGLAVQVEQPDGAIWSGRPSPAFLQWAARAVDSGEVPPTSAQGVEREPESEWQNQPSPVDAPTSPLGGGLLVAVAEGSPRELAPPGPPVGTRADYLLRRAAGGAS